MCLYNRGQSSNFNHKRKGEGMVTVVLTADRDNTLAGMLEGMIHRVNPEAEVEIFDSGDEVISHYLKREKEEEAQVVLVILALRLYGEKNGPQVAKLLRKKGYEGPIIAFSGGSKNLWEEMIRDKKFFFLRKADADDLAILRIKLAAHTTPIG
ncbi:MAG: hypothetical protein QG609_402 [Patescibacteria group bacterium]|nr:hypothetical protein [Patescibacteria group bacterium]